MIIREYNDSDIYNINKLGNLLHDGYNFKLDEFSKCHVFYDNDKFIGFIVYFIIYDRSEIVDIIIDPNYRKKGYGNMLLKDTILKISNYNVSNITLEVNSLNKNAINLYLKNGFLKATIRKNYYKNSDGILMIKDLR